MNEPEFNWLTALEDACREEPTEDEWLELRKLARSWPTCACGELCKDLPRFESGCPMDETASELGTDFLEHIIYRHWPSALATFHAIEARTAELLKET